MGAFLKVGTLMKRLKIGRCEKISKNVYIPKMMYANRLPFPICEASLTSSSIWIDNILENFLQHAPNVCCSSCKL
jgi:hypothetical protein